MEELLRDWTEDVRKIRLQYKYINFFEMKQISAILVHIHEDSLLENLERYLLVLNADGIDDYLCGTVCREVRTALEKFENENTSPSNEASKLRSLAESFDCIFPRIPRRFRRIDSPENNKSSLRAGASIQVLKVHSVVEEIDALLTLFAER